MKKKKKSTKKKKAGFSKPLLFKLVLDVFKASPNKKLNYKQVSRILKIKELGVKISVVGAMKELSVSGFLEEIKTGSYRLVQKIKTFRTTVKSASRKGVFVEDGDGELFISKENSFFALTGDVVDVLLFPKRKNKNEK